MVAPNRRKRGFTLIETVVTVGIIAALAAVVYPQVVKQFDTADPTRAAQDLNNIKTAIETFGVNVKPEQPGDMEDLVNQVTASSASELNAARAQYSSSDNTNWNGPYLGLSIPSATAQDAIVLTTGFGGQIWNEFARFDVDAAALQGGDSTTAAGDPNNTAADFVALRIGNLSGAAFDALNEVIDGPNEATVVSNATNPNRRNSGLLRCPYAAASAPTSDAATCPMAYYLAVPMRH